jgi:hypothetical protein
MAIPTVTGHDFQGYTPGLRVLTGSFATNGSSDPAEASTKGVGFTVARSGTGVYTITITAPIVDVVAMQVTRSEGTAGTFLVSPSAYSTSTRQFTVTTTTPGAPSTASNVAAATDNRINFSLFVKTIKGSK